MPTGLLRVEQGPLGGARHEHDNNLVNWSHHDPFVAYILDQDYEFALGWSVFRRRRGRFLRDWRIGRQLAAHSVTVEQPL